MKRTLFAFLLFAASSLGKDPLFLLHEIDRQETETVVVMDYDGDGRLEVGSGLNWYKVPAWRQPEYKRTEYLTPPTPDGRFGTNGELAMDVDKDGLPDLVVGLWGAGGIWYFHNPGKPGVKWTGVKITDTKDLEGLLAADVDGDGNMDILPALWSNQPYYWIRVADGRFTKRPVALKGNLHGLGFGDVDGDGKKDITCGKGWFRQIDVAKDQWEFQPDFGLIEEASIPMLVYDVNADGLPDVIYGEAHDYGLFWMEQRATHGQRSWVRHEIDPQYSQIHVLAIADFNGDGKPDIVAGKRYRAHNDGDPGAFDPIAINYYSLEPGKEPKFTRYPIAFNSLAGVGTSVVIADLDGDGDLDIVVGGKSGQYWFENLIINYVNIKQRDVLMKRFPSRM